MDARAVITDDISIARVSSLSNEDPHVQKHMVDTALLYSQQHFSIAPQFFEIIVLALVRREKMDNDISIVEHKPALLRLSFHPALFLEIFFGRLEHGFGKRIEHTVTGSVADDEIIGKRCNILDVEKQDVFTLFVLQGGDDFMCKFECVQVSPHKEL